MERRLTFTPHRRDDQNSLFLPQSHCYDSRRVNPMSASSSGQMLWVVPGTTTLCEWVTAEKQNLACVADLFATRVLCGQLCRHATQAAFRPRNPRVLQPATHAWLANADCMG